MAISPDQLEHQANRLIGEDPVILEQDQPGVVSIEGNKATVDRTSFISWIQNGDPEINAVIEKPHPIFRDYMEDVIKPLDGRERLAIRLRYGLKDRQHRTFTQIGQELGVHRTTASRILVRGMKKLRRSS